MKVRTQVALCLWACAAAQVSEAQEQALFRIRERVATAARPAHQGGLVEQEVRRAISARIERRRAELDRDPARAFAGLNVRGDRPGRLVTTERRRSRGAAQVETLFVGASLRPTPQSQEAVVERVADQVALVIHHTDARGRDVVVSLPIHITLAELTALATDAAHASQTELGRLIRAVQQQSHLPGTHSTLQIYALNSAGDVGKVVGRLPTSLLDLEASDVLGVEQTGERLTARRLQREAERASWRSQAAGKGSTRGKGAASLLTSADAH